jgi:hypothetical protein
MAKRIAVLIRERQEEGLRVAVGLTLVDNAVRVFVVDCVVARTPPATAYLGVLRDMGASLATTCAANADLELLTVPELARQVLLCDHILAY